MAPAGPDTSGTVANFNDGGAKAWTNPTNAQGAPDGVFAVAALTLALPTSQRLRFSNFGFAIPAAATIVGVLVEIDRKAGVASQISDQSIELLIAGAETGTDKSAGAFWSTALTWDSFGGSADLWGLGITVAQVNAAGFGFSLKAVLSDSNTAASVDAGRITVYYHYEGSAARAETITITTVGVRRRVGTGTRNETLSIAAAGVRRLVGAAARAETLAIAVAGVRRRVGTGTRNETLSFAAAGVRRVVSTADRPEVITIAAAGVRRAVGAAARNETFTALVAGVRCAVSRGASTTTLEIRTAGVRIVVGSAALTCGLEIETTANVTAYGSAEIAMELGVAAAGVRRVTSTAATLPLDFTYAVVGDRRAVGAASFVIDFRVTAESESAHIIRGPIGSGHIAASAQPRLAKQAAGATTGAPVAGDIANPSAGAIERPVAGTVGAP